MRRVNDRARQEIRLRWFAHRAGVELRLRDGRASRQRPRALPSPAAAGLAQPHPANVWTVPADRDGFVPIPTNERGRPGRDGKVPWLARVRDSGPILVGDADSDGRHFSRPRSVLRV